jgi:hypothetical protein
LRPPAAALSISRSPRAGFSSTYEPKTGFYGNLAIGRYFRPNWRYEFEFAFGYAADGYHSGIRRYPAASTSIGLTTNVIYDFKNNIRWTPFIGAGAGCADCVDEQVGRRHGMPMTPMPRCPPPSSQASTTAGATTGLRRSAIPACIPGA